jgi:hypothetical protein
MQQREELNLVQFVSIKLVTEPNSVNTAVHPRQETQGNLDYKPSNL